MVHTKEELEAQISKKKTLGTFVFDENKKHFTTDVPICLVLEKQTEELYKAQRYFFDGYEVWLEEDTQILFEGNEEEAKGKAIQSWNEPPEQFLGYPIRYTQITCEIDEDSMS